MIQSNEHENRFLGPESIQEDAPLLARFAEQVVPWTSVGGYDETADVWIVDGKPLATSNQLALATVTFTKAGGEPQDRD